MEYIISTPCGQLRGAAGRAAGTVAYKGIRYATAGRWEYPVPVTRWEGIYDATDYGPCAWQPRAFYNEAENLKKAFYYREFRNGETYTYSEDCLFLNVFTPEGAAEGDGLPVLIYIHGGGFVGGCGHEKHFDGPVWPAKGVIGVTLNYRLGPLGFACLPELREEVAAIRWVKDNIRAFGGDPENITVMGQSAGAMSIQQLCLSPLTDGLFQRAVMSSGGGVSRMLPTAPAEKRFPFWQAVMKRAGCDTLEQLRAIPPEMLFEVWQQTQKEIRGGGCFPVMDGRLVVGSGTDLLAAGRQKQIHYMAGATSEDMIPPILFGMAKKWCAAQVKESYVWYFERQLPGDEKGAWHSSDLWYWFGTLDNCWRPMERRDYELSDQMVSYLCSFARSGNPNDGHDLPEWRPSGKQEKQALCLGDQRTGMKRPPLRNMIVTMLANKPVGE